jgi:chemotaxis signal transduction protein
MDMRIRLDYHRKPDESEERVIIIGYGGRIMAAKVDSVSEVLRINDEMIEKDLPEDMLSGVKKVVKGVYRDEDNPIYILDCNRVFGN